VLPIVPIEADWIGVPALGLIVTFALVVPAGAVA
jgi:hypothetical protein